VLSFLHNSDVKQNECVIIPQTCASCTYVNMSITYKNTTLINNVGLEDMGGGLWTYSFCNTGSLGRYDVQGSGDLEGTATGFDVLYFNVTPSGQPISLGFYFLIFILSIGLIILGFYIQDNWVVVLGGFAMIFLGLFLLFYGIDGFKDEIYTWGSGIIILMLGAYFSVRGSWEALS